MLSIPLRHDELRPRQRDARDVAPAPALPSAPAMPLSSDLFVDGAFVPATTGETFPVTDPATGETIAHAADGVARDAARAVDSASRALPSWSRVPVTRRAAILQAAA